METREVRVLEHEGQRIFAVLHLPEGEGPFPVVVVHHGFGGNKVGSGRIYVDQAEALSREGIATFRFDFRGCGDSEGQFDEMTLQCLVADALHCIEELKGEVDLDMSRLGLLGASLGGSVACLVAEHVQPKSVALWAPVARGELWVQDSEGDHPQCSEEFGAQFLAMSADEAVGRLDIPLLHAHGDRDEVVLPSHADLFAQARPEGSRFLRFPNSCHSFVHPEERTQLITETARWFSETL